MPGFSLIKKLVNIEIEKANERERHENHNQASEVNIEGIAERSLSNSSDTVEDLKIVNILSTEPRGSFSKERISNPTTSELKANKNVTTLVIDDKIEEFGIVGENNIGEGSSHTPKSGSIKFKKRKNIKSTVKIPFSKEEDSVILSAISSYGDKLSYSKLCKKLNRSQMSVEHRCKKLKSGKDLLRKPKSWTLIEDQQIIDAVIEKSKSMETSLKNLDLSNKEWKILGSKLERTCVYVRWNTHLKPWLLQHYHGTLNCNIDSMLVNHVADCYSDCASIDWNKVSQKREFSGHSIQSIKHRYGYLRRKTMDILNFKNYCDIITPRQIADTIGPYNTVVEKKKREKRQQDVIRYFETHADIK